MPPSAMEQAIEGAAVPARVLASGPPTCFQLPMTTGLDYAPFFSAMLMLLATVRTQLELLAQPPRHFLLG